MIVIIVCVLLAAVFGNASASSQQTTRVFTFESEVHSGTFHGFDTSAASKITVGVQGKFTLSRLHQTDTKSSCSWLLFQLTSVKFVPSSQDGINSEILNESSKNGPFLVQLCAGRFKSIFLDLRERVSIKNLKKAIAALFQYQITESHLEEIDVCGSCQMTYKSINSSTILKLKEDCKIQSDAYSTSQSEPVFATTKDFKRLVLYQVNEDDPSHLIRAKAQDEIIIYSAVRKDLRISVISSLDINFVEFQSSPFAGLELKSIRSVEEALDYFIRELRINLERDVLNLTMEYSEGEQNSSDWKRLEETIDENRKFINESYLGTNRSVAAFIKILNVVQRAEEEDIIRILKDERNEPILNQLMDIFGCAQSVPIQEAILKTFDFKTMRNIDPIERYLWAISVNEKPNIRFLRDFVELLNVEQVNEKLRETVLLTVAALAEKTTSEKLKVEIFDTIMNGSETCPNNNDMCISSYLRALKNLKFIGAKSVLLNYALTGSRMVSANALKAVYNLPRQSWDNEVLNVAEKIYYQKDRLYDSTARSIAIDILVDAGLSYESLNHLIGSLQSNKSHETRKYLLQRLQQVASTNEMLDQNLRHLMKRRNLFNYNFLSQKGLSNAIRLPIIQSENLNASIVTINEVSKNVLRRGHVGIILEQSGDTMEFITLDLFTSGLSSFLWSDDPDDDEEMDEPEKLIAGVEIAIYGVQMRPFFFFHGHAELMGHIWAGTASERTPILQALRLLLQTNDLVPVSAGHIVRTNLMGAMSFKLAGRITFSIWNKNAYSLGEASVAATIAGSVYITTFSVQNELRVVFAGESQIDMASNLDFYEEVLFCLQISQPQTAIEYESEMRQTNLNNNHTASRRKKVHYEIPGSTIHLNKKNDEMCNLILQTHSKSR